VQPRLPAAAAAAVDAAERRAVKRAAFMPGFSWRPAYVAVGSNLNQPRRQVCDAFERLAALPDTRLELRSRIYLTRPMGPQDQPDFVNAAAGLLTRLGARALLDALLAIELAMGRRRQERWGPRIIDLDLLWMHGEVIDEPGLTLPHPGVSERNFVLYPLCDIAPTLMIPGHGHVLDLKSRAGSGGISVLEYRESRLK
jgi:2-amino-4-hydroxy-6-hydroxymethyldihydropteridine diphosphokinase